MIMDIKWSFGLGQTIHRILLCLMICAWAGCSNDPDPGPDIIPSANTGGKDTGSTSDSGDADVEDVGGDADAARDTLDDSGGGDADVGELGGDADADADENGDGGDGDPVDPLCGAVIELGDLSGGYDESFTLDFTQYEDRFSTSCTGVASGSEAVFAFRLVDPGNLHVSSDAPLAIELRVNSCRDSDRLFCSEVIDVELNVGPKFYLVVEHLEGAAIDDAELQIRYESPEVCDEVGLSECLDEETLRACNVRRSSPDIPRWGESECPTGCADDRCLGDSCAAPIVVEDEVDLVASHLVLFDQHNSFEVDNCGPNNTPGEFLMGRELVFELPNLTPEHRVVVETYHPVETFSLLFKESCDDEQVCLDQMVGEGPHIFEPPAEGTYYLFAETHSDLEGSFEIRVEVQSP